MIRTINARRRFLFTLAVVSTLTSIVSAPSHAADPKPAAAASPEPAAAFMRDTTESAR